LRPGAEFFASKAAAEGLEMAAGPQPIRRMGVS
jgi:hypothetical protein